MSDNDDDNDNEYLNNAEKKLRIVGNAPTMVIKRARSIRTENTPTTTRQSGFAHRSRQPSPPVVDDHYANGDIDAGSFEHAGTGRRNNDGRNLLSTGIKQDSTSIVVGGFDDYQREDGLKGEQGASGSSDQYNIDYMREYNRRLALLDENPDYQFAKLVLGFTNGDVFYILEEGAFRREIERSVARAREEARKAMSRADTISELRKEAKVRQDELKEVNARYTQLQLRSKIWQQARDAFFTKRTLAEKILSLNQTVDKAITIDIIKNMLEARGLKTLDQQTFDVMLRVAYMKYGFEGVFNRSFAIDVEQFFRLVSSEFLMDLASPLKDQMPQVSDVALYIATLKALSSSNELLVNAAKKIAFQPESVYAKSPVLFAFDMQTLAEMLIHDSEKSQVIGTVSFSSISLLFYAHLNEIVTKLGLPNEEKIAKPTEVALGANDLADKQKASSTRRKKIFGKDVDINVDDSTLAKAAVGEKTAFTEEELLAYRKKLFVNNEAKKTVSLIQKILLPLFQNGFGSLFFVNIESNSLLYNQIYGESRYPVESPQLVRTVFQPFHTVKNAEAGVSVAEIFDISLFLLGFNQSEAVRIEFYDKKQVAATYDRALINYFIEKNSSTDDWLRYEKNLRNLVVKRTVLPEIGRLLSVLDDDVIIEDTVTNNNNDVLNLPVIFTESEKKTIFDYLKLDASSSVKEQTDASDAVLAIYDNRIPYARGLADKTTLNGIKQTPSNWSFNNLVQQKAKDPAFPVPDELQKTKDALEKAIDLFKKRIAEILSKTPDEINKEIEKNLGFANSSSRQWASLPTNSGILTLSARFMSALADATRLVREEVPNLAGMDEEDLQYNIYTKTPFARLVAHKILQINATNPGQYQRDKTTVDLKIMIADDINALRSIRMSGTCSNFGRQLTHMSNAPNASRLLKRDFAEFFK